MSTLRRPDLVALVLLLALAGGIAGHAWSSTIQWKPDSLFYRSQVLRIQGMPKDEALRRVFEGPLAAPRRAGEASLPPGERKVSSAEWVRYSSRFYERRWMVPLVAAAFDPALGARGLLAASLLGYVLVAPLLYLLLRLWFPVRISLLVAAVCLLLFSLRTWSGLPLTDSFGLAVECLVLLAGALTLRRGGRWLALWALAVLALSFTRDASVLAVVGGVAAFLWRRDRTSALLALSSVAASLPAPLLFGAPLREAMAYTLNDFFPPAHATWGFVADHYATGLRSLVRNNLTWLGDHPADAIALVGGFVCLPLVSGLARGIRPFLIGAAATALVYDALVPNYTGFRLELVFVPFAALGLGALATALEQRSLPLTARARSRAARARGRSGGP